MALKRILSTVLLLIFTIMPISSQTVNQLINQVRAIKGLPVAPSVTLSTPVTSTAPSATTTKAVTTSTSPAKLEPPPFSSG